LLEARRHGDYQRLVLRSQRSLKAVEPLSEIEANRPRVDGGTEYRPICKRRV